MAKPQYFVNVCLRVCESSTHTSDNFESNARKLIVKQSHAKVGFLAYVFYYCEVRTSACASLDEQID